MTTTAHDAHDSHGDHPKFLAHHFETPQQQFDSGKLGVWLFLTTEVLLFSGLFCAYAVYRANHPEIFTFAHLYLNKWYGALNTIVLIFSSFTMAWGVLAAQLGQRKRTSVLLIITLICGAIFMCIKGVEYHDKWREHLLPGNHYNPTEFPGENKEAPTQVQAPAGEIKPMAGEKSAEGEKLAAAATEHAPAAAAADVNASVTAMNAPATRKAPAGYVVEQSVVPRAAIGATTIDPEWARAESSRLGHEASLGREATGDEPHNAHIFFGIYFLMTGLHGLHVLAGMSLIAWCLIRNQRGDFSPEYFSPVDFVGLYWHIVDLVWIFLFPLLYLIGNTP